MSTPPSFWTGAQAKFLREHYVAKGGLWCAQELGRSVESVKHAARRFGICRSVDDIRHPSTPAIDDVIRRAYQSGEPGCVKRCADSLRKPTWWVSGRANAMGLTTRPQPYQKWTTEEAEFLEANSHLTSTRASVVMRKRGWKRSPTSIKHYRKTKGLVGASDRFMPAATVALCFGVHSSTVTKWISEGLLEAAPLNGGEQAKGCGARYLVENIAIARMVVQHPTAFDIKKVDAPWFIDIVARYGLHGIADGRTKTERIVSLSRIRPDLKAPQLAEIFDTTPESVTVMLCNARGAERKAA